MEIHLKGALVLIALCSSGILGENSSSDWDRDKSSFARSHVSSGVPVINQSENSSAEYIEIVHKIPSIKSNRESRYNYSIFSLNSLSNNSFYTTSKLIVTNVKADLPSTTKSDECSDSSDDFPDILSLDDLRHGALALVILVGIYCFTILAIICDRYFLPCMEVICEVLNLSQDVAAATFMSIATSTPELFVNIIGTFVTKSDLGVGTIVGSSLFNTLGVAAIGSLAASKPIQLNWWPLTRDTIIYGSAVCLLITITWDNIIFWYEGLILFLIYFFYFTVMFNNHRIWKIIEEYFVKSENTTAGDDNLHGKEENGSISSKKLSTISPYGSYMEDVHRPSNKTFNRSSFVLDKHFHGNEDQRSLPSGKLSTISPYGSYMEDARHSHIASNFDRHVNDMQIKVIENNLRISEEMLPEKQEEDTELNLNFPKDASFWGKCLWIYTLPIKFVLSYAIPDVTKYPKLFPVTFIMCIVFIGLNSYVVSWMITLIGNLFKIPDAVLGFTFLAAGGCLPETISITIMSRRGEGSMGVSNSLGANTMNILMSLGLPWFIKTISMGTDDNSFIRINSGSMEYIIMGLILVAILLYLILYFNNFQLRRRGGVILMGVYLTFVTVSIVAEMLTREGFMGVSNSLGAKTMNILMSLGYI